MREWLLRQLGITDEFVQHVGDVKLRFQIEEILIVGLILLLPLAVGIYLRQRRNLPTMPLGLRLTLTTTRVLILLLLIVALAGPYLQLGHTSGENPGGVGVFGPAHRLTVEARPVASEQT